MRDNRRAEEALMLDLILASTSPWRQRMLRDVGIEVRCEGSGVDESAVRADSPTSLVRELAVRKARAVADRFPDALVLGADQVAYDPRVGEPWGKPPDPAVHLARLRQMRGREHLLVTGWALLGPEVRHVAHTVTRMHVRADLDDSELAAYVATGEGSGCAGGYAAEGRGAFLFSRIEGDWFNVLGLPLFEVIGILREHGWRFEEPHE